MQLTKLTVEEWVIKQPKFLGQLAAMLATIADDLPQMLELVFTDQISKKIGPPPKTPPRTTQTPPKIPPYTPPPRDPTRWVRFYRDHRQVMRVMLSVLPVQMSPEMFDDLQPFSHKLPVNLPSGELPNIQTKNARKWKECIGGFCPR